MIIIPEIFKTGIQAISTTRKGGVSIKPYNSLNFGAFGKDAAAQANIDLFAQNYAVPHKPVFMHQIHTCNIIEYTQVPTVHGLEKADACFTRKKNLLCSVLSADCLPVLMADKQSSVVAAVHCGWRGLYAGIIEKTIQKIDIDPGDLNCWLGPCISYKPYRVDEKFRLQFVMKNKEFAHCFYRNKKGSWHADLKKIALTQLQSVGVKNVLQSPYCTHDNKSLFYSYRRDGETGRMASMIWLN